MLRVTVEDSLPSELLVAEDEAARHHMQVGLICDTVRLKNLTDGEVGEVRNASS